MFEAGAEPETLTKTTGKPTSSTAVKLPNGIKIPEPLQPDVIDNWPLKKLPSKDKSKKAVSFNEEDADLNLPCRFVRKYNFCLEETCNTERKTQNNDEEGDEDNEDTTKGQDSLVPCKNVGQPLLDELEEEGRISNYGCVGLFPLDEDILWQRAPGSSDLVAPGQYNCGNFLVNYFSDTVIEALPIIAQIGCYILMSSFKFVLDVGTAFIPGPGKALDAGLDMAATAAQTVAYIYPEEEKPEEAFGWWFSVCSGTHLVPDEIKQFVDLLNTVPDGMTSFKPPKKITKGSGAAVMRKSICLKESLQKLTDAELWTCIKRGTNKQATFPTKQKEHQLKGQVLKDIKKYYGTLELADPKLTATPEDNSQAIQYLTISKGYSRNACRSLTTAKDNAVRHWREAGHSIAVAAAVAEEARWTEVRLQTWIGGKHACYWIVRDDSDSNGPSDTADAADNTRQSAMDELIAASQARLEEGNAVRLRKGDLKEDIDRDSLWVKRLGWVRHFGSRDLINIHDAARWLRAREVTGRSAGRQEDEEAARERLLLRRLGESFDREVERCCWPPLLSSTRDSISRRPQPEMHSRLLSSLLTYISLVTFLSPLNVHGQVRGVTAPFT
ncbi:hypothetical protein FGADI_13127 [Fusarium gaditjirri]|uniref:Uncharacterized protein n=1 Tax=Fusarium gaditjirri TaxID=282569 RepID=A0A8H4WMV9_9HYPO|nr:hypothetical protein FGADI_13127 [Fusarium gaditjirri]